MSDSTILQASSPSLAVNVPFVLTIGPKLPLHNTEEPRGVPDLVQNGYDCIRFMGFCTGGHIYLGKRRSNTNEPTLYVAVKKFGIDEVEDYQAIAKESAYLRSLKHDNILSMCECFVYERHIYQITPAMNLGSLFDIVFEYKKWGLNEKAMAAITHQVLDGLNYLHERRFIHRDVKTRHILIDSRGNVKLTGFRFMVELSYNLDSFHDYDQTLNNQMYYLAPEVLRQNMHGYNSKSDIYMLGICICEAVNGVMPFAELKPLEMLLRKMNGQVPRPVDKRSLLDDEDIGIDITHRPQEHRDRRFSDEMHDFVANCLNYDPRVRGSASDLKNSYWLGSEEFANLTPLDVRQELQLDYSHFELSTWEQQPVLPKEPEQKYEIGFVYDTLS